MTVMSEWLADCSTRARLRPGKRSHQEYGGESSIEPVVRVKRRSAVGAEIHRQLLDKSTVFVFCLFVCLYGYGFLRRG